MKLVKNSFAIKLRVRLFSKSSNFLAAIQTPHGGKLESNVVTDPKEQQELIKQCGNRVKILNERQSCDVELLINGGFSPLKGFMNQDVYQSVLEKMRLPGSSLLFGLPVVLDSHGIEQPGEKWLLKYNDCNMGVMEVESKWIPSKPIECKLCYKSTSIEHPGVRMVAMERGEYYIGGKTIGLGFPKRLYPCKTPAELRAELPSTDVVAFQCRNPIHKAHYELFIRALSAANVKKDGVVLVHPTMGPTQEDDIPGRIRYDTYEVLKKEVTNPRVRWAYLPYSMHMAGPREAIQHMIIRKNYGCTHFIIGRDMAGSKSSITGEDYYEPYEAQEFAKQYSKEIGIDTVTSLNLVYTKEKGYITAEEAESLKIKPLKLSGTEFRKRLRAGEEIPEWFAFKSVVEVLRHDVMAQPH
jgi:sulfate adenylyltransferase